MATRRAESLPRCRWLPAVRARRRNGPSQGKVEKEPEQVRDERCDQCPEDGRHAAPSSICIDISQAENPDCDHQSRQQTKAGAWHQNRERGVLTMPLDECGDKADQYHSACYPAGYGFNGLRNNIKELTNAHWDNPFSFVQPTDNRCRTGNSRQKHREGTIHKASNPRCKGSGSR